MSALIDPSREEVDISVAEAETEFVTAQTIADDIDKLERRAVWLDAEFKLPLTDQRVGVSSIVGLLPGGGDGLMALVAMTILYRGIRLGAPTGALLKMSVILLVEAVVSVIPIVGDAIGLVWSANIGNVGRLRRHQQTLSGSTNWWFVLLLFSPWILFVLGVVSLL